MPKEYIMSESEEAMNLRHQREILELQNLHLMQKRSLLDRKQNILSNNSNSILLTNGIQSNTLDIDDGQKVQQPPELNFKLPEIKSKFIYETNFTISPFSSGIHL